MVDISSRKESEAWLQDKPREWAVALAARAALRVLPLFDYHIRPARGELSHTLPVLRNSIIALAFVQFPARTIKLHNARVAPPNYGIVAYAAADAAYSITNGASFAAARATAFSAVRTTWQSVSADATALEERWDAFDPASKAALLAGQPLWLDGAPPKAISDAWFDLSQRLREDPAEGWDVWIEWYEDLLAGRAPWSVHAKHGEDLAMKVALQSNEDWEQPPAEIDARIRRWVEEARAAQKAVAEDSPEDPPEVPAQDAAALRERLADAASPQPYIDAAGKLDAHPNPTFDKPQVTEDLATLPMRQRRLIAIINSDLPGNVPRHLQATLIEYDQELLARGAQPILGILKDCAAIIQASVGAKDAHEWLQEGLVAAFRRLLDNHALFEAHFPLDLVREQLYEDVPTKSENPFSEQVLSELTRLSKSIDNLKEESRITNNVVKIVNAFTEHARAFNSLPSQTSHSKQNPELPSQPFWPEIGPKDRRAPVPAEKRAALNMFGFFERAYNLLGSTATLAGPATGNPVLERIAAVLHQLAMYIQL